MFEIIADFWSRICSTAWLCSGLWIYYSFLELCSVFVSFNVSSSAAFYFSPTSWHVPDKSLHSWPTVSACMCHHHSLLLYPQESMLLNRLSLDLSHLTSLSFLPLSLSLPRVRTRTLTLCSSTIWMFRPSRIVGNHAVQSCAPSIQTRKSGPSGPRKSWLASSSPCVSIWMTPINHPGLNFYAQPYKQLLSLKKP